MSARRKLVLVDGSSYLYRAFHALPPLTNSRGEPTGAVLGVLNMLQKLCKEESPELIAVVFDAPGRTFRDDLFDAYKAQRTPMPDDLRAQLQPLLDCVEAMGLPLLRIEGVEADDVIGTLATRAAARDIDVLISTGDKDMAQLVSERITLVNTMTGTRLDRGGVKAKFDVFPEQIADYLALVGDTIDNIPGVPKVGPKTAAKWLNEYGSLATLVREAHTVAGKVGESLRDNLPQLELSRKLASLDCQVALDIEPDALTRKEADRERLRTLYTRLELRAFLRQLNEEHGGAQAEASTPNVTTTTRDVHYECVTNLQALREWCAKAQSARLIAFHLATHPTDYLNAEIMGFAFALEPNAAIYVPVRHRYAGAPEQISWDDALSLLRPLFEADTPVKVGVDLKFDAHVLARAGVQLSLARHDVMLESYVWNSTATRHELEALARKYLGVDAQRYEDLAGRGAKQLSIDQLPLEIATRYVAEQADLVLQCHHALWGRLSDIAALTTLYEHIEQPLAPVLERMEACGVLIDGALLRQQSGELAARMQQIERAAHEAAGGPFSLESPKQLQDVLFGKLGLPVIRKTPTGQPSTAEDVLEELAERYELPRLIMDYRALTKLKSTYTDKLPLQIQRTSGRVHTCYQQAIAATGRLSSTEPNLQNIPIRTAEGRRIRQAFIAPAGWCIVAADYSQIELRIMAHLSGDEGLLRAFSEDRDIHFATAAEVFGASLDQVTAEQRRYAKMINFGLIYGMSAFGLASRLGIERSEAQRYVDLYFQRYPGVRRYMDETRQLARDRGYVETVFGRRLYLNDISSRNHALRQGAERAAINAPMQGTAADIIKRAMITVDQWLQTSGLQARLILQVHDELVFEVQRECVDELTGRVRELMCAAADLRTPLRVDVGTGDNWDEAH